MAEAVIGSLAGKLQDVIVSEAQRMAAVNDDIRTLLDKLVWIEAFLHDAEPRRRQKKGEHMKVWLQQTRKAFEDAEDAVDRYFVQVDLSRYPSWTRATVEFFAGFTTQVRVRRDLSYRIRAINTRLEGIIANKDRYKMDDASDAPVVTWRLSAAISTSTEKMHNIVLPLVARETHLDWLMEFLKEKNDTGRLQVMDVIGGSGVGKTKLVGSMYEEHRTKNHFDVQAWVSFAPNLSAPSILKLINDRLKGGNVNYPGEARRYLDEVLTETKYLLVIDGEVSSIEWKRILSNLPNGKAGSKIVRITVNAPDDTSQRIVHIRNLIMDDATKLFQWTLFIEGNGEGYLEHVHQHVWERFREDIFDVTGGLPLAVVLLSGLLRTKECPVEWFTVFEYLKVKAIRWKRLDTLVSMCFDDLPHDLKSCFMYFAALPVNTPIRARSLVCMWMAEGFLGPKDGKGMEKVGEDYLKELIVRRLVNLEPAAYQASGDERVAIQSKVHAFLLREAQEARFVEVHSGDDISVLSNPRRLSLQGDRDKYVALVNPLPRLRSILTYSEKVDDCNEMEEDKQNQACPCLHHLRHTNNSKSKELMVMESAIRQLMQGSEFLRVITLHGLEIGDKLPSDIGNLVHLQYLGITSCSLKYIPPSIGKIAGLQTLDVRDTNVTTLPEEFWKIRELRHVFGFLVLPKQVGRLRHLQTLESIELDDVHGWERKTLQKMIHLRSLYIWKLPTRNANALTAVCTLQYIVLLTIHGDNIISDLFTNSNLPRLQEMRLKGVIVPPRYGPFSDFYLPNMTKLSLENTKVTKGFINNLGKLPFLATLALNRDSYIDKDHHLAFMSGFHSLKELVLVVMLKKIEIGESVFPQLEHLEVFTYSDDICAVIHGNRPLILSLIERNNVPCVMNKPN